MISDSMSILNPTYFLDSETRQQYVRIAFGYDFDHRDLLSYPLNGYYYNIEFNKSGVGLFNDIDMFTVSNTYNRYEHLGGNFYSSGQIKFMFSYPEIQPYYNLGGFGYNQDFVRGYELYVINGQAFGLMKLNLKYRLLSLKLDNTSVVSWDQFNNVPFNVYLKLYSDMGYVRDHTISDATQLGNEYLLGWGAGIDISTYYDLIFRIEYSINRLLEKGVYLHLKLDI